MHGHVWSRTSHSFEALGSDTIGLTEIKILWWSVSLFSVEDEYTMVVKVQHVVGQYFETCLHKHVYIKIFLVFVWGTHSKIC